MCTLKRKWVRVKSLQKHLWVYLSYSLWDMNEEIKQCSRRKVIKTKWFKKKVLNVTCDFWGVRCSQRYIKIVSYKKHLKLPKCKHTSCKVIAFTWPIPLKKITKRKRNSNISDIFDFMETFQDNIFQSIKKENVPTTLMGCK